MTSDQIFAFSILGLLMIVLIWDQFRYDVVGVCALLLSWAVGIVPTQYIFSGFSDDIVIIVASALLVSYGVSRSGVMELVIQRFLPQMQSARVQLIFLVGVVTALSAFVKNIGALAIMLPVAFQFARRSKVSPSLFLMPMAFGSLIGGLMTEIGTSPNIVVSAMRAKLVGEPFTMFDFTPVGAVIAVAGICYLVFFSWLLPNRFREANSDHSTELFNYISEASVPENSPIIGKTIAELEKPAANEARVRQIIRNKKTILPLPNFKLENGDIVVLIGVHTGLDAIINSARLEISPDHQFNKADKSQTLDVTECVITFNSPLIGQSARTSALFDLHGANLLALSRQNETPVGRLGQIIFKPGDVIVLQGLTAELPKILRNLRCLPLAKRKIMFGSLRGNLVPVLILVIAMTVAALQIIPVALTFFAAAVAMVVFRVIPGREIYKALNGQILVMLAALIPVSGALESTGCTDIIGYWLSQWAASLPDFGAVALILVAAMLVTPFLNNAATVMVMAPIASSFAQSLSYKPEAFLMAVAIGAGCDFLTPIGHQCNMLVMAPGGYKFSDYPRFGAPLSVLIAFIAVPTLLWVWPVK